MNIKPSKKAEVLDLLISNTLFSKNKSILLKKLSQKLSFSRTLCIATPNPEQVWQASRNNSFLKTLLAFDMLLPDGIGLVWASRLLGNPITQRITGIEIVRYLLDMAQKHSKRVCIIGGRGYESTKCRVKNLKRNIYQLQRLCYQDQEIGWIEGYENVTRERVSFESFESKKIQKEVSTYKPDVIFVALGAPFQEKWIIEHRDFLREQQVAIVMAVGGSFDVLFGKLRRAPAWILRLHVEWLFRLVQQPWRWKRQLRLIGFVWLVVREKVLVRRS